MAEMKRPAKIGASTRDAMADAPASYAPGLIAAPPRAAAMAILVAALGYFVDIYDLILFSIVRVASLKSIGVADADLLTTGVLLAHTRELVTLTETSPLTGLVTAKKAPLGMVPPPSDQT